MHLNSELLFKKYFIQHFRENFKVLEIGPSGGTPTTYQKLVNNSLIEWDTIDFEDSIYIGSSVKNLTYKLDNPYIFPIRDEYYDIVLSGQVIEHVAKPWKWLKEIKRVTKNNGVIMMISPISWPYHEAPVDCWRIYPSGIKAIADEIGLSVELCLFESLEKELLLTKYPYLKFVPGQSFNYLAESKNVPYIITFNRIVKYVPFFGKKLKIPIEIAFDCVSILKKSNEQVD